MKREPKIGQNVRRVINAEKADDGVGLWSKSDLEKAQGWGYAEVLDFDEV